MERDFEGRYGERREPIRGHSRNERQVDSERLDRDPQFSRSLGTGAEHHPEGDRRSDERLREDICEQLMRRGDDVDASEVTVEVKEGIVTLQGAVPERRMKHAIEDIVDDCTGVKDIDNRLRVTYGEHRTVHAERARGNDETALSIGTQGGLSTSGVGDASSGGSTSGGHSD